MKINAKIQVLMGVALMLGACGAPTPSVSDSKHETKIDTKNEVSAQTNAPKDTPAGDSQKSAIWQLVAKEKNTKGIDNYNAYIVIPKGLTATEIVALVHEIHQAHPDAQLWIYDEDQPQMIAEYAKLQAITSGSQAVDLERAKELAAWHGEHQVAMMLLTLYPDGTRRWVLDEGAKAEVELEEFLPCIDGQGGCKD